MAIPSRGPGGMPPPPGNFYILRPQKQNLVDSEHKFPIMSVPKVIVSFQFYLYKLCLQWFSQSSRLTFQLSSQVAGERFDFTSQNKFSLARLFLHKLVLCSKYLIFSRVISTVNMPLCNLKSEELVDYSFQPLKILTHRIQSTMCLQGKFLGVM